VPLAWKILICVFFFFVSAFARPTPPAAAESPDEIQGLSAAGRPAFAPGDTWTIRFSDGTRAKRKFLKEEHGTLVFEVTQTSPGGDASPGFLYLNRDLATLKMLDPGGVELRRFEPHSLGLQFPLAVGREWQGECRRFDEGKDAGTYAGAYKVVRRETVTVPAGTFQAFRVEGQTYETQAPGKRWRFVHWYSTEARIEVKLQAMTPDGIPTEFELSEYVPAGRAPTSPPGPYSQAFLGTWEGHWKEMILATRLTVERVEDGIVTAVYWRGAYIFPGLQKPSRQRIEGRFLDQKTLGFEVWDDANSRWAEATYTLSADGTLTAVWKSGDITATARLEKEP